MNLHIEHTMQISQSLRKHHQTKPLCNGLVGGTFLSILCTDRHTYILYSANCYSVGEYIICGECS